MTKTPAEIKDKIRHRFTQFITSDKYKFYNPDKPSIEQFLEQVKSKPDLKAHELIDYAVMLLEHQGIIVSMYPLKNIIAEWGYNTDEGTILDHYCQELMYAYPNSGKNNYTSKANTRLKRVERNKAKKQRLSKIS